MRAWQRAAQAQKEKRGPSPSPLLSAPRLAGRVLVQLCLCECESARISDCVRHRLAWPTYKTFSPPLSGPDTPPSLSDERVSHSDVSGVV